MQNPSVLARAIPKGWSRKYRLLLTGGLMVGIFAYALRPGLPKYPESPQYRDGKFSNAVAPPARGFWEGVGLWRDFLFAKPAGTVPDRAIPVRAMTHDGLMAAPDNSVWRLGHSSLLLKLRGKFWLIDPVFSERASPVQWAGPKRWHTQPIALEALPPIEAVILSHDHYDHLDHAALLALQAKVGRFIAPLGVGARLGQFSRNWETTPDGREGFQNIFLRRGFATYLVDQPRRGSAGRSMVEGTVVPKPDEQMWFNQFRLGVWPDFFNGIQFSHDKAALIQYFRQMTPNTGPFDLNVISDAISAVVDKTGNAILFTHSQGGGPGWYTAMKNSKVKAIIAFEPGSSFVFPEQELPAPMPSAFDTLKGDPVAMAQFMSLTKIPVLIVYGDNIPSKPTAMPAQDSWRVRLAMARQWRDVVNKHGGDATVIHLPEIGIKGNTHFPFSDLNNVQIADLVSQFLKEKGLQ